MIFEAGPLNLKDGAAGITSKVHPSVLVTICDSFVRRSAGSRRVIGTLLGTSTDNEVTIKACYAVPHEEDDEQVKLDVVHHKTMLDLHQKVAPKDTVVGWFATGLGVSGSDALIHNFYSHGQQSGCGTLTPIHLVVDTSLSVDNRLSITGYIGRRLTLDGTELAAEFVEVPTRILTNAAEGMALDVLKTERMDSIPGDAANFKSSFAKLQELISEAHAYVTDVLEGRREADVMIGRQLSEVLGAVPCSDKAEFKKMFDGCTQDILLVLYLSNLVRSHVSLAEKLSTFALPLL